ncbi:MAG: hypothetical protein ACRDYC_14270 [Acidimicrobiales bacterium]
MARFLSPAWFDQVAATGNGQAGWDAQLTHHVKGTPDGDVIYRVLVSGAALSIVPGVDEALPGEALPGLAFTSNYATAAAIAKGEMSAEAALAAGLLRVSGDVRSLPDLLEELGRSADPVPDHVRLQTTY